MKIWKKLCVLLGKWFSTCDPWTALATDSRSTNKDGQGFCDRSIPRVPDIWKSLKSHPQLPIDSLQPWSKDSFNFFIFIYLVDALWGQHLYMYKVFWQSQPQQFHPLAGAPAQLNNYEESHKLSSEILVVGGSKRKSCWGIIKLLFDRSPDSNCNLACTGTTSYHFLCHKRLWCSQSTYKRKQFYYNF